MIVIKVMRDLQEVDKGWYNTKNYYLKGFHSSSLM